MLIRQIGRPASLLILITIGILGLSLLHSQSHRNAKAQGDAYEQELLKGKDLLRRRNYEDALKSFKRENEMRGKKTAECYNLMSVSYFSLEAYKNDVDSAEKVIELAGGEKGLLANAYNNKGLALQVLAQRKDQKKLQA